MHACFVFALSVAALLSFVVSAADDITAQIRADMETAMIAQAERAFKSDDFAPVGSAREKALSSTAYSPIGSVYQTVYMNSDGTADYTCANELSVNGYAVNYCIVASNFAFKFQLTQSSCYGGVTQYFSDKACTNYLGLTSLYGTSTCSQSLDYQHYLGQNAYQNIRCITSGKPVLPTSNYIAQEEFDNTKCSGNPFSYLAFVAGKCFLHKNKPAAYTCNNGLPTLNYYSNTGCMGSVTTFTYPSSTCYQGDVNIGDDDWEYIPPIIHPPPSVSTTAYPFSSAVTTSSKVFCQANAPTMKPAFTPSAYPTTSLYEQVSFTVTQVIDGIDSSTYASSSMNSYTLVTTIASVMTGVPSSAVINMQISDINPTRRRRLGDILGFSPQSVSGKAIAATYTVATNTIYSQDQLYSELSNSVISGQFTSQLNSYATSLGAPNLSGCSSNTVSYYGDNGGGGSGSLSLSIAAIIGIVVGVLGGITLITALVVWIVVQRRRAKTPLSAQGTYNANPTANPNPNSNPSPNPHMHHNIPVSAPSPSPYSPPAASVPAPLPVANPV